jgi:hypothetical protein
MKSKVKSVLIIFFDIKGIIHKEFILAGQTVYYCDILRKMHEKFVKTSPRTLMTKEVTVASPQRTVTHFLFHQGIFNERHDFRPQLTLRFSVSPIEDTTERAPFSHN